MEGMTSVPLIPREVIFGNPEKSSPLLSPDGQRMCYLAPDEGVLNVWLRVIGANEADDRPITRDRGRGIRSYLWAEDGVHVLYIQDKDGDENWHLHAVNWSSGEIRDLTPFDGVRVEGIHTHHLFPGQILLGMNQRDPSAMDLHRCDLASGELKLEAQNPGAY